MANKISLITVGSKWILQLDSDPSIGGGFTAPVGSEAYVEVAGVGSEWFKFGAGDLDWEKESEPTGYLLTGISFLSSIAITATDSILSGMGKLQAQISSLIATNSLIRKFVTASQLTNSSNVTNTNITDMLFSVEAGKKYKIDGTFLFRTVATGTGIAITMINTTALGTISVAVQMHQQADGTNALYSGSINAFGDLVKSSGVQAANVDYICEICGIFICTTSGSLNPQFRSEVSGSLVTIQIGSILKVEEI